MPWPLDDRQVLNAVSRIREHSEREASLDHLAATFVDPGIIIHLNSDNNQIIFGRRGTGKTHVLKILQHMGHAEAGELPVYIDMRTLGSSAIWEQSDRPAFVRVANLLKDVLGPIQTALLDFATRPSTETPGRLFESVNDLAEAINGSILAEDRVVTEHSSSVDSRAGLGLDVEIGPIPRFRVRGEADEATQKTMKIVREGRPLERILFRQIGSALDQTLKDAGIHRLLVLLDEWNAIPSELQPLLAEFLRRTFFPSSSITVKVAAIEYRCTFGVPLSRDNTLGFELSGDISASLDLDEFFVFDRDEHVALKLFAELLYRHVAAECDRYWMTVAERRVSNALVTAQAVKEFAARHHGRPGYYLDYRFGVKDPGDFISAFFDDERTFAELARAGEGVARDFIRLFHDAAFDVVRRRRSRIDIRSVRQVARDWYAKEKAANLDLRQAAVLQEIMTEVIGHHKARSFMFDRGVEKSDMIRSLMDLRLIHLVKRGFVPDGSAFGKQYNVYTLDYGTYVHALGTERAPTGDFSRDETGEADVVVPFHDDRAIKRIVLEPALLERDGSSEFESSHR
jgi:hypothetical protein